MKILITILLLGLFVCCNTVKIKRHGNWMGPETWEAYKDGISVGYYNGNCCCVAEKVLKQIVYDANHGILDWNRMRDKDFQDKTLSEYCEMIRARKESE